MKKCITIIATLILSVVLAADGIAGGKGNNVRVIADKVAAWQISNFSEHASLLAPLQYSSPENSASGFMTYGLAWGVNHGILKGKLQYVQLVAGSPEKIEKDMTEVYGVGAFLLAASEIIDF